MKEYTLLAVLSVIAVILIDKKSGINLFKKKTVYLFLLIIAGFKLLVNGYLTGAGIVIYNPRYFLGFRLGSIPLEDFLFGTSMVVLTIISWEFFKQKDKC